VCLLIFSCGFVDNRKQWGGLTAGPLLPPVFKPSFLSPGGKNARTTGHSFSRHREENNTRATGDSSGDIAGIHNRCLFSRTDRSCSCTSGDFLLSGTPSPNPQIIAKPCSLCLPHKIQQPSAKMAAVRYLAPLPRTNNQEPTATNVQRSPSLRPW
jgi:hypothetical protein